MEELIDDKLIDKVNQFFQISKSLEISQPQNGYRFSIDPFFLVSDLIIQKSEQILDIGTGCGIMPLLLALKYPEIELTAVEIQSELAKIARENIEINGFGNRIRLINHDIKDIKFRDIKSSYLKQPLSSDQTLHIDFKFDRVISNPPYKKRGSGRLNPNIQKAIARHEISLTLDELICCASQSLKLGGIFNLIYPAIRIKELLFTMKIHSIKPINVKFINTSYAKSANPKLVLTTGIKMADITGSDIKFQDYQLTREALKMLDIETYKVYLPANVNFAERWPSG